jgi:3-oxoacid CoA-transferase subunit A
VSVYVTGDKHGNFYAADDYPKIRKFCLEHKTSVKKDYLIILGDHGVNFWDDDRYKQRLLDYPINFILIHGNHDRRAGGVRMKSRYISNDQISGLFYMEERYPNILYTKECGAYVFAGNGVYVMGGAYSVDKDWRLEKQLYEEMQGNDVKYWFPDEQLTEMEKRDSLHAIESLARAITNGEFFNRSFVIMSHTCPLRHIPTEMFMDGVDQKKVDRSMEEFFDKVEDLLIEYGVEYKWLCGHWHTDKVDGPLRIMYHDIIQLDPPVYTLGSVQDD